MLEKFVPKEDETRTLADAVFGLGGAGQAPTRERKADHGHGLRAL